MAKAEGDMDCKGRPSLLPGAKTDTTEKDMTSLPAFDPYSDPDLLDDIDEETLKALRAMSWREPGEADSFFAEQTMRELDVDMVTALRLEKENFTGRTFDAYREYLDPTRTSLRSPEETVEGMQAAGAHLVAEIDAGRTIALFADYDVDGTTSGYLVLESLKQAGASDEQIVWDAATTETGFGLTSDFVRAAGEAGATTLITVDCGSTQVKEIALAQELGMTVIVVDHHDIDLANTADLHLNPNFAAGKQAELLGAEIKVADKLFKDAQKARQAQLAAPNDPDKQAALLVIQADAADTASRLEDLSGADPAASLRDALLRREALERQVADAEQILARAQAARAAHEAAPDDGELRQAMLDHVGPARQAMRQLDVAVGRRGDKASRDLRTAIAGAQDAVGQTDDIKAAVERYDAAIAGADADAIESAVATVRALRPVADGVDNPVQRLRITMERSKLALADLELADHNTGAQLSWKLGASVLEARQGATPDSWYGTPMYLASMGAVADMADLRVPENRAFCRIPAAEAVRADDPAVLARIPAELERVVAEETRMRAAWRVLTESADFDEARTAADIQVRTALSAGGELAARLEGIARHEAHHAEGVSRIVPPGVRMLAEGFDEDPGDQGSLIRTRAALNIPKRSTHLATKTAVALYQAPDEQAAKPIVAEIQEVYEYVTTVRDEMADKARKDFGRRQRKALRSEAKHEPYFAVAVLDGYEEHVGQAGVIAQKFTKEFGRPAAVLVRRGVDAEGKPVYKCSMRNGVVKKVKIGELRKKKEFAQLFEIAKVDDDGSVVMDVSLGGHADVNSGVIREENIPRLLQGLETYGQAKENRDPRYGWYVRPRNAVWVTKRLVGPERLGQLEREARKVAPATNGNFPTRISVAARIGAFGELHEGKNTHPAIMQLTDGQLRRCDVTPEAKEILECGAVFEVAISLGDDRYWVRDVRPIDRPRAGARQPAAA